MEFSNEEEVMMKEKGLLAIVVFCLAILGIAGCVYQSEDKADEEALTWMALLDDGEYGKSWDMASAYFKTVIARDKWEQSVTSGRKPLGRLLSRKMKARQATRALPGAPDGEYVVIKFESSFEGKAKAWETVTPMRDKDGLWRVGGYYLQ